MEEKKAKREKFIRGVIDAHDVYVGIYASDGSKEECTATLIFGEGNKNASDKEFDWKWIELPCPQCKYAHTFKRSAWYQSVDLEPE